MNFAFHRSKPVAEIYRTASQAITQPVWKDKLVWSCRMEELNHFGCYLRAFPADGASGTAATAIKTNNFKGDTDE